MPSKTNRKRLARVAQQLLTRPVPEHLTKAAFAKFCATGETPVDQRVGAALLKRVQSGIDITRFRNGDVDWGTVMQDCFRREPRGKDDFMDGLIQEALFARGLVQAAAQQMLIALASAGFDVTSAQFADRELPAFGSVGLQLMGFPQCLARRPYVRQVRRLTRQLEGLQSDLLQRDRKWFEDLGRAVECFQLHGDRPEDACMLEAVLISGEINTFMRHACGDDVRDLLRLFDAIATTKGDDREQHIEQLVGMAQDGAFRPDEE